MKRLNITCHYRTILLALLVAGLLYPTAVWSQSQGHVLLQWRGCGITKKAFMAEASAAYKEKTGKRINLSGGGATLGIRTTAAGDADFGGTCRPVLPNLGNMEQGIKMTHVGWDALVAMVHPDNPVKDLTTDQLKQIMTGKIRYWSEVGGTNHPIVVVVRRGKINGVGYMARKMLFNDPYANFYRRAITLKSSGPVEMKVESNPHAIGISGISSAQKRKVKLPALNGYAPTKANLMNGNYPYFRPLYLVTKGNPQGEVKSFLDWLLSNEGQQVVKDAGTVNLSEGKALVAKFEHWENPKLILNYKN